MSLASYNLSDDWGWYVDIENINPNYQTKTDFVRMPQKRNVHFNRLETIIEHQDEEYQYHFDKQKILDDIFMIENNENINENTENQKYITKNILKISSTTMITAVITYVLFYIL
jgi:hypothetical protein